MALPHCLVPLTCFMLLLVQAMAKLDSNWYDARATFYGDAAGGDTMQGACGYGDLFKQGYGLATTALSTALFNKGSTCGACFEIICVNNPQWCIKGARSIKVTATNFCPPDYSKTTDIWCNPPQKHFDLSYKMFTSIAYYKAGVTPVKYRRVPCSKSGGVRFELKGNPYFLLVLVYNVANAGDVSSMSIKGSKTGWIPMTRNWGQKWNTGTNLVGQALSFKVTTSDGTTKQFDSVSPSNWQFEQIYESKGNF
ncbi:expansin-A23-like [Trifolium pratense]|uniref:expansin-A23-like n=1 Tax=Trifolium pratense TaxID=57577 RepID=UPI001E692E23|nr:expansin-A23-like [Trifolium pratense]